MCWRVIKYIFKYLFYIGIGLIKKGNKNQMKLKEDFFKLAINRQTNNIIELYEDDDDDCIIGKDKEKIINKINSLKNELNYVNNLIHYIDEKLLIYENNNNFNLDNILNLNNQEYNKNNTEKISNKKYFYVVKTEKKNQKIPKKNHTKKNLSQIKTSNSEKKYLNEKDNSFVTSDIKERKDFYQSEDDEISIFNINEYYGIYCDKNEINLENKNGIRKSSNSSNYSIEGKISRLNYDNEIFI